jgi:catalase
MLEHGAVPVYVAGRLGPVDPSAGPVLQADVTMELQPPVLFDALVLPAGQAAVAALVKDEQAIDFVKNIYRHCKPILALDGASALLDAAHVPPLLPDGSGDPGVLVVSGQDHATVVDAFLQAVGRHRHFEREAAIKPA